MDEQNDPDWAMTKLRKLHELLIQKVSRKATEQYVQEAIELMDKAQRDHEAQMNAAKEMYVGETNKLQRKSMPTETMPSGPKKKPSP